LRQRVVQQDLHFGQRRLFGQILQDVVLMRLAVRRGVLHDGRLVFHFFGVFATE